ncbi:hypothetical protein [Lentzea sp. NBRC 102530]|uniref:hypothetical protein n=1 Tax=Lentzea sp. NBRC 102530 TaxID=3032201 RepID=UPI0024A5762F|nr:hypothetical protein [Lentzea sp. NBRC 102530]GLY54887.1 hypothetical protein Lesp01_85420 [Lentzea sp. NBRC 102530]
MLDQKALRCQVVRGLPELARAITPQLYATGSAEERAAILTNLSTQLEQEAAFLDGIGAATGDSMTTSNAALRRAEAGIFALWADVELTALARATGGR